jgi:hypothetical protein
MRLAESERVVDVSLVAERYDETGGTMPPPSMAPDAPESSEAPESPEPATTTDDTSDT